MFKQTDEPEPEWVAREKEHYTQFRDQNGDGVMDANEVKAWILPASFNHAEAESKHLVFTADVDKVKR